MLARKMKCKKKGLNTSINRNILRQNNALTISYTHPQYQIHYCCQSKMSLSLQLILFHIVNMLNKYL